MVEALAFRNLNSRVITDFNSMNLITGLTRIGPSSFFVSTRFSFQKLAL